MMTFPLIHSCAFVMFVMFVIIVSRSFPDLVPLL